MTPRWDGGWVAVSCTQGLGPLSGLVQEASAFTNSCTGLLGKISLENVFFCYKTFDTQSVNSKAMNRMLSVPSFLRYMPARRHHIPYFSQCFTSLPATCTFFYNEKKLFKHTRFRFFQSTTEATVSLILCKKKKKKANKNLSNIPGTFQGFVKDEHAYFLSITMCIFCCYHP